MTHFIIMPAYGHRDLMEKAIHSIVTTVKRHDICFLIKYNDPAIQKRPEGFTKATNDLLGFAASDPNMESVTLIATDVEVATDDWLTKLLDYSKANPDIGMIAPQELLLSENYESSLLPYTGERLKIGEGTGTELVYPIWAMVFITKECLKKVGFLDEAFSPGSYDDFDYGVRARIAGFKSVWFADVQYRHVRGATLGPLVNDGTFEYPSKQADYFYKKWKGVIGEGQPAEAVLGWLRTLRDKVYTPTDTTYEIGTIESKPLPQLSLLERRKKELGP